MYVDVDVNVDVAVDDVDVEYLACELRKYYS